MKKGILLLSLLGTLAGASFVLAAGSGAGNGGEQVQPPERCEQDIWECDAWSACDITGISVRTCTLAFNCPTVTDPRPSEKQACERECERDVWSCTGWSECLLASEQHRSCVLQKDCELVNDPAPIERQRCRPGCTQDSWECSDWLGCVDGVEHRVCELEFDCVGVETPKPAEQQACSTCTADIFDCSGWQGCGADGVERRTCELQFDCPTAISPLPAMQRACEGLQCGQLHSLSQRLQCRLLLTSTELEQEFSILYFPEYCKHVAENEQIACIENHQELGTCWQLPIAQRSACAKEQLGIQELSVEKKRCMQGSKEEQEQCIVTLQQKVKSLIIFYLSELEVQAESLYTQQRVTLETIVDFQVVIENAKQELATTDSLAAWRLLIWQVEQEWKQFIVELI